MNFCVLNAACIDTTCTVFGDHLAALLDLILHPSMKLTVSLSSSVHFVHHVLSHASWVHNPYFCLSHYAKGIKPLLYMFIPSGHGFTAD